MKPHLRRVQGEWFVLYQRNCSLVRAVYPTFEAAAQYAALALWARYRPL
jgi:hypothetical protein